MDESLSEKLKSLGMQIGAGQTKPKPKVRPSDFGIEAVVQGSDMETQFGPAFISEQAYDSTYRHGRFPLCITPDMSVLAAYANTPRICEDGCRNVVFLDTETSGLMGGTGTYAFLVGIGYRTENGFALVQFFMRDPAQEPALLAALDQFLSRFEVVVTFNGKTFDLPLLSTRCVMNGVSIPFQRFEHVDVLHIARKLWRDRLPSRALGELEREIVQYYRSGEDIPGWMIPDMYFEYLRTGDARPLSGIFYHNAIDILSLAALYNHIGGLLHDPLQNAVGSGFDMAAIARLYEEMGRIEDAAALYERALETGDLPEEIFFKTMERYALMRRRQGDWEKAISLWRKAAAHGQLTACIELSKYYEHRERNASEALVWANKALELLRGRYTWEQAGRATEKEIERRVGRLSQRVYKTMG